MEQSRRHRAEAQLGLELGPVAPAHQAQRRADPLPSLLGLPQKLGWGGALRVAGCWAQETAAWGVAGVSVGGPGGSKHEGFSPETCSRPSVVHQLCFIRFTSCNFVQGSVGIYYLKKEFGMRCSPLADGETEAWEGQSFTKVPAQVRRRTGPGALSARGPWGRPRCTVFKDPPPRLRPWG